MGRKKKKNQMKYLILFALISCSLAQLGTYVQANYQSDDTGCTVYEDEKASDGDAACQSCISGGSVEHIAFDIVNGVEQVPADAFVAKDGNTCYCCACCDD